MNYPCPICNSDLREDEDIGHDLICDTCGAKCKLEPTKKFKTEFNPTDEAAGKEMADKIKGQIAKAKKYANVYEDQNKDGRVHLFCPIEEMAGAREWFKENGIDPDDIVFNDETDLE